MSAQKKPSAPVVKLQPDTHRRLQRISREQHRPMGEIVGELLDHYERDQFWLSVKSSVDRLRIQPDAWQDYQDEIALFEGGSIDTADEDPYFTPDEEEQIRVDAAHAEGR